MHTELFSPTKVLILMYVKESIKKTRAHCQRKTMCTQGDQKVVQPEVLHLLLARNECDKVTASTGHVT
jgi:hypothetical protein